MMNYVIILLCGSSLISQSSSSWSFIYSVGLLHFILGLTCLSKYFGQAITHFPTVLLKSTAKSFKTVSLDFAIKYFTEYSSLSPSQDQFTSQEFSSRPPFSFLQMLICRKKIYGFVPRLSSPRLAGSIRVKDCLSCFLVLCAMHRNILPSLSPSDDGLILILACQLRYLCVQQIIINRKNVFKGPSPTVALHRAILPRSSTFLTSR